MTRRTKKLVFLVLLVFILTPLGILTDYVAWGEWEHHYFKKILGFIPEGIKNSSNLVTPLIPKYQVLQGSKPLNQYLSAILGVALIFGVFYLIRIMLKRVQSRTEKG